VQQLGERRAGAHRPPSLTVTLDDGNELRHSVEVLPAATHVGGPRAVPARIACDRVTLRRGRTVDHD